MSEAPSLDGKADRQAPRQDAEGHDSRDRRQFLYPVQVVSHSQRLQALLSSRQLRLRPRQERIREATECYVVLIWVLKQAQGQLEI